MTTGPIDVMLSESVGPASFGATRAVAENLNRRFPTMTTNSTYYGVDDEFGSQITTGLATYDAAVQVARHYLSAHDDAPAVSIYVDTTGGESWVLARAEALS